MPWQQSNDADSPEGEPTRSTLSTEEAIARLRALGFIRKGDGVCICSTQDNSRFKPNHHIHLVVK